MVGLRVNGVHAPYPCDGSGYSYGEVGATTVTSSSGANLQRSRKVTNPFTQGYDPTPNTLYV